MFAAKKNSLNMILSVRSRPSHRRAPSDCVSMPPSKRRKTSDAGQRTAGDASLSVIFKRPASVSGPAPAPPGNLVCPISFNMFRDPVMVVESGHTYDRNEITQHFAHNNRDPKTNLRLRSTRVVTNWGVRDAVEEWLNRHPDVTPDGWDSRELLPAQVEAPVQTTEPGHGDALVLQMWRDMCPELQAIWEVDRPPEQWRGVTMVDGRVVRLDLSGKSLSQVVPACIGRLTALMSLNLGFNKLTSLPAEIGQLTSLERLDLTNNRLTSVLVEIGQLTSLVALGLGDNQLTSVPAEIGQLRSLTELNLEEHRLRTLPAAIGELAVRGCTVFLMKADE